MWEQDLSREEYLRLPKEKRFVRLSKTEEELAHELQQKYVSIDVQILACHNAVHYGEPVNFQGIRDSGLTMFFEGIEQETYLPSLEQMGRITSWFVKNPDIKMALCAEDVRRAKKEKKQTFMFVVESDCIANQLDRLEVVYGLGARMMILTKKSNYIGGGANERQERGLTYFGLEVVKRMNELGVVLSVAHSGHETIMDTVEVSKDPIVLNHNCAQGQWYGPSYQGKRIPHSKAKTDEEIKAISEKGGIIGIMAIPNSLTDRKKQGIDDVLDHIDYTVKLVGADHVGIGSDILFGDHVALHKQSMAKGKMWGPPRDGWIMNTPYMWGIENPGEWPNIVRGLVSRGYSNQEIEKITGANALKLIERVVG